MNCTQAPLPFTGQKRRFLKVFKTVLNQHLSDDGVGWTIVDVFGGSGLLSHTAKRLKPAARVIYNDFDGYAKRLTNINDTNRLREILLKLTHDVPRNSRLNENVRKKVQAALLSFDGFVDVQTVASWLLFSGQQVHDLNDLLQSGWYARVRLTQYDVADDYLDGLEIVSESYTDLIPKFINQDKVLLLIDPPYICTEQGAYRNETYFGMVEFLRLMRFVRPPFVFFSSTRSELLDYLDFVISDKAEGWQNLKDYQKISVHVTMNKTANYEDNMVFKF